MRDSPFVSFVILTFNSEKYLDKCINSILNQNYSPFEIVIIDAGSTDSTLSIINGLERGSVEIRVFNYPGSSIGFARQKGTELSRGEYCAFIDSDCILRSNDWLKTMMQGFDRPGIVGVWSLGYFVRDDPSIMRYTIMSNPTRHLDLDIIGIQDHILVGTGHTIIQKAKIMEAGGFRDVIAGEDIDLTNRLMNAGYQFRYIMGCEIHHFHVTTFRQWVKKTWRNFIGGMSSEEWKNDTAQNKKVHALSAITIVYPLYTGIRNSWADNDPAWLWHPVLSFSTVVIGLFVLCYIRVKKKKE